MDETRKARIIAELLSMMPQPYDPDTDISAAEAAESMGCDIKAAQRRLRELVSLGELVELDNVALPSGKAGRAWRAVR